MSKISDTYLQLGNSATASQNFVIATNNDGTFKISRGNVGATTADIITIDAGGNVTPNASAVSLGVGQTWQNVTASRTLGTTYSNLTGKPIVVALQFQNYAGSGGTYICQSNTIPATTVSSVPFGGWYDYVGNYQSGASIVIPVNTTYLITYSVVAGTAPALMLWMELR